MYSVNLRDVGEPPTDRNAVKHTLYGLLGSIESSTSFGRSSSFNVAGTKTGRFRTDLHNTSNTPKENSMFKKSLALSIVGLFTGGLRSMPIDDAPLRQHHKIKPAFSSGKGKGKRSVKPSGAAALKRAATRRNNIRKHK